MERIRNNLPRYAIRVGDLQHWHVITVSCPACGHKGRLDATALGRGQNDYTRIMDLERRLRYRSCGNLQDHQILVTMTPRQ